MPHSPFSTPIRSVSASPTLSLIAVLVLLFAGIPFAEAQTSVGSTSSQQSATVTITTAGTVSAINVLTQGGTAAQAGIALDFGYVSGGTCAVGTAYTAGQTCTVNYTFAPKGPGQRVGAVQLSSSAPAVLGSTLLSGTGGGPLLSFVTNQTAAKAVPDAYQYSSVNAVAVAAGGTVYEIINGSELLSYNAAGQQVDTNPIPGAGNGVTAYTMALDGAGNLYFAVGGTVLEMLAVNGSVPNQSEVIRTLSSSFTSLAAIAVDASGNVYVSDNGGSGSVVELVAVNGSIPASNPTKRTLLTGTTQIGGLAVDASGNVFYAGYYGVGEILASGTTRTIGSFPGAGGIAVDAAGNLYVGDNSGVKELLAVSGTVPTTSPTVLQVSTAPGESLLLDGKGKLYFANSYPGLSYPPVINLAVAPALSFNSTALGVSSSDSPKTQYLQNIGNATLNFTAGTAVSGASFTAPSGASCPAGTSGTLASGVTCTSLLSFAPKATGSNTGSLTVGANSLNVSATQTSNLTGTGVADAATIGTMNVTPASLTAGASQAVTILDAVAYNGPKPTGAVKFTLNSVAYTATCTGSSSPLSCTATVPAATVAALPAATYSITSALAADASYAATTGDTGTLTVQPQITLTAPAISPSSVDYGTSQAVTLTTSESYSGAKPTGAVTFSLNNANYTATCTGTASPLTCTATVPASVVSTLDANSYSVVATSAADSNYPVLTSASATFTVNTTTPTLSAISFSTTTWVYGNAPALTLTVDVTFSGAPPSPYSAFFYFSNSSTNATCTNTGAHTARCTATYPSSYTNTVNAGYVFTQFYTYPGTDYAPVSTYDESTLVVTQANKTITFPQPANGTVNGTATLTATASGGDAVTYSIVSGNATLTGSNTVKYTGGGPVVIAADSAASTNYNAAPEVTRTVTVAPGATTLTQTAPTAVGYGTSTTLKATLTFPGAALPTGAVTFTVAGTAITATCTGSASPLTCTASSPSGTNAGSTTVTAAYAGDTAYNGSSAANVTYTINKANVSSAANPTVTPVYGNATVTLTFTGTMPAAGVVPTAVTFRTPSYTAFSGSATCAVATAGTFTCTQSVPATTYTTGTQYAVTAVIGSDTNYNASATPLSAENLTVGKQTPTNSSIAATQTFGNSTATIPFSVAYTGTLPGPTGTFNVSVNAQAYQAATCTGTSSPLSCTITYPFTSSPGSYHIGVSYSGDTNFTSYTASGTLTVVNQQATFSIPTITIAQGAGPTTISATESWIGSTAPTNSVTISVDGGSAQAATCTSVSSTSRSCSISYASASLGLGNHPITSTQAGASPFDSSSGTGTLTVTGSSTLTLVASQPSAGSVQLTATAAGVPSTYSSGTVTFYDAGSAVCSGVALTNATAICVTPTLSSGTHSFTAVYTGDATYAGSNTNASPVILTIDPATNTSGGSRPPGTQSAPVPVTLAFGSNTTLGAINLSNAGSTNAFTVVSGGTCTVGTTYTAGQSCTVYVVYTNPGSGLQVGTLALQDNKTPPNTVGSATVAALGSR